MNSLDEEVPNFQWLITKHITHPLCHANSLGKEISNFTLKYINYHYLLWLHTTTVGHLVLCNDSFIYMHAYSRKEATCVLHTGIRYCIAEYLQTT